MSKSIMSFLVFLVLVLIIFVSSSLFANLGNDEVAPATKTLTATSSKDSVSTSSITITDVQKHNNQSGCWTVVGNGVFDLTSFVSSHSGGAKAILSLCGIDGTSAFLDQHGNQKRPNNELAGLKIGDLTK